ncbi:DUF4142 domain-containing protein [Microvirga lotononidis]|uniref:Putative outer membrane protein n=1 Tax=Microvirga lotononidis TaxID=864069 RepID=I4Z2Q5_9HYPH|nr:DUF4142 domain-containing protein [Microvirga lotononidis]EIM30497.1 putative outer membrane protein [Microvirga lotononidis]WQO26334.1 DUF4142 domain-containing protein [Microvirga lotononidis]
MRRLIFVSIFLLLPAASVPAQIGNPAGMPPGTAQTAPGTPAPHQTNAQDRLFVDQATIGGMAEVEFGRLAERKSQNDAVKAFARQMVQDHTRANDRLADLARQSGTPQAGSLDDEHRAVQMNLEKLTGHQFDLAYADSQVQDHQKTAQLLAWEIGSGQEMALKQFASEILPIVLRHLEMAQDLKGQLTGTGPQGVSASASDTRAVPARPGQKP